MYFLEIYEILNGDELKKLSSAFDNAQKESLKFQQNIRAAHGTSHYCRMVLNHQQVKITTKATLIAKIKAARMNIRHFSRAVAALNKEIGLLTAIMLAET